MDLSSEQKRQEHVQDLFHKFSKFNVTTKKFEYSYCLKYEGKSYSVCKKVFAEVNGFRHEKFKQLARTIRDRKLKELDIADDSDPMHDKSEILQPFKDSHLHPYSAVEMNDIIAENVVGSTEIQIPDFVRSSGTPLADRQQLCIAWLDNYFKAYSDKSPNSLLSKVSLTFKKDLHDLYVNQITPLSTPVSYNRFLELWLVLFPYCINRPWCNVPGKCETCFMITEARTRHSNDIKKSKMLQQLHAIHRGGMFMLERNAYKQRILDAMMHKDTKMSIIIDGMDQSHCMVPYYGQTHTFADPIVQHITGVKEHGHGVTIYRTLGTVNKGANLTIYCILTQIEEWKKRHNNKYPEELYLQGKLCILP